MKSKIVHQKIPTDENGRNIMPIDEVTMFHKSVQNLLPDDYTLITSPFDTKILGDEDIILIGCKQYTGKELLEIIEKGNSTP